MDDQPDQFQTSFNTVNKVQKKLDSYLKTINQLLDALEQQNKNNKDNELHPQIIMHCEKVQKYIPKAKSNIEVVQNFLNKNQNQFFSLQDRYNILRSSQKMLQQTIIKLKQEASTGRKKVSKKTKLSKTATDLEDQVRDHKQTINRLLLSQNKEIRLSNEILSKLKELEGRENFLNRKLEWEDRRQEQANQYSKQSHRYSELQNRKRQIREQIENKVGNRNKQYIEKLQILSRTKSKIKQIQQIANELEMTIEEQQFIMKQIKMREGLMAQQILQNIQPDVDQFKIDVDHPQLQEQLAQFTKRVGLPKGNQNKSGKSSTNNCSVQQNDKKIPKQDLILTSRPKQIGEVKSHPKINLNVPQKRNKSFCNQHPKRNYSVELAKKDSTSLPKISTGAYQPITHSGKNSSIISQIGFNRLKTQQDSDSETSNQQNSMEPMMMRIRTKNGYIYKKMKKGETKKQFFYESKSETKSEIVNLFQKLSKRNIDSDHPVQTMSRQDILLNSSSTEKNESQTDGIRLKKRIRKGKEPTGKQMMQSRQSDCDDLSQSINHSTVLDRFTRNNFKQNQDGETRKRLNTIHERDQTTIINQSQKGITKSVQQN